MRRILISLSLFLAISLALCGFAPMLVGGNIEKTQPTVAENAENDSVFLLIGVDQASYNADVAILVRMKGQSLSFLQLPRDSLLASGRRLNHVFAAAAVAVKNKGGSDKEAFSSGGKALSALLGQAFGITVKAHAVLTLQGLRTLVDCIGGVEVTLERDLSYDDPVQGLTIRLSSGRQTLDGRAAEGLVRCRNAYPDADYGRMRAQCKLIKAVFAKVRSDLTPLTMLSLFRRAYHEVETDLAFRDALPLLGRLSDGDTALRFATLTGEGISLSGASVEALSEVNLKKCAEYLGGTFDKDACRAVFCYPEGRAREIYESKTPLPFCEEAEE